MPRIFVPPGMPASHYLKMCQLNGVSLGAMLPQPNASGWQKPVGAAIQNFKIQQQGDAITPLPLIAGNSKITLMAGSASAALLLKLRVFMLYNASYPAADSWVNDDVMVLQILDRNIDTNITTNYEFYMEYSGSGITIGPLSFNRLIFFDANGRNREITIRAAHQGATSGTFRYVSVGLNMEGVDL